MEYSKKLCSRTGELLTKTPDEEIKFRAEEMVLQSGNTMSFKSAIKRVMEHCPELALAYRKQFDC